MVSGIVTVALLVLFLVGWAWAWRPSRKADFDAAARLPLEEDELGEGKLGVGQLAQDQELPR